MVFGCHDNELSGYVYNNQLPQWPCFRPIPGSAIGCTVVQTLACSGTVLVAMSLYTQPHPAQSMNAVQDQIFCHASRNMRLTFARGSNNTIRRFVSVESNAFSGGVQNANAPREKKRIKRQTCTVRPTPSSLSIPPVFANM